MVRALGRALRFLPSTWKQEPPHASSAHTTCALATWVFPGDATTPTRVSDEFAPDVERIYRILRKFHSRPPNLDLALQESGVHLRPGLVERVVRRCGDAGALGFRLFAWASRQPGHRPTADAYKAVVRMLGKMRQFGAAWALVEEMRRETPELISPELFVTLMRRFASARMARRP